MKQFFLRLSALALIVAPLATALPVQAATLTPGSLIKGPGDAVYYYAQDGKRYVFPNSQTYFTWYADFSSVQTISAGDLAEITIGGNVTYRPGVKLVKVTTDPKVYAVSSHGTLRWMQTEALATALYGTNWSAQVNDIPDAFFTNYTRGADIVNISDFSPATQTNTATSINVDKQLTNTEPQPPSTPNTPGNSTSTTDTLSFSVSHTIVQPGDTETLNATYNGTEAVSKIELFFNGSLIKTCTSISCSGDALVPSSGVSQSYIAQARLTKLSTQVVNQTITVPVETDGANLVRIQLGQESVASGQADSIVASTDASIAVLRIDIYLDGNNIESCANGARACSWSGAISGDVGSVHPVYARVTDTQGRIYTSPTSTITVGTNDTPNVSVAVAKTTIYVGETVDVTVTATNNDGIASIDVMKDGNVLKRCNGASPCTLTSGPWNTSGATLLFSGRATGSGGTIATSTARESVSVITPNSSGGY